MRIFGALTFHSYKHVKNAIIAVIPSEVRLLHSGWGYGARNLLFSKSREKSKLLDAWAPRDDIVERFLAAWKRA